MFVLDSRLQQDTFVLGDLPLSRVLLSNDARYPWFILVPRREDVSEVFQLDAQDQQAVMGGGGPDGRGAQGCIQGRQDQYRQPGSVSYTHLTLPTKRIV